MASGRELKKRLIHGLFILLRHPRITGAVLLILAAVSLASVFTGTFRNDVSRMLPDGSEAARCYEIIARSSMFNKAPILFHAEDPGLFRTAEFSEKLERLVRLLEADERILRVDCRLLPGTPEEILSELVSYIPQYLPLSSLPDPAAAIADCRRQFLLPGATGRGRLLEADPLSLASRLLLPLEHFRRVSRFSSAPDSPYLVSPDGRSLLVLLETAVPATDPGSGRALLTFAEAQIREAGFVPGKDAELLFPHRRAMANEAVVKADILQVSILSLVIFSLLTIFIYRCDLRAFLIPAVPFLSALFTAALMPLVFRTPLFFIVGMGGIVISLALDYGIHMYAAMTGRGSFRSLTKILPPLLFAALTSGAAFLLFLFGATDAVRQLGFFSGVSLLLSLLLMLLLLPPAFAHRKGRRKEPALRQRGFPPLPARAVRIVWLLLIVVSAALIPGLRVHSDARQFDLSPPEYEEQDAALIRTFQGGAAPAMALFRGETAEQAKDAASAAGSVPECFSVSELYPRKSVREKNLEEWRAFGERSWAGWTERLRAEADKNDFDPDFFTPFLNRLHQGIQDPPADPPACFRPVLDRLLVRGTDGLWTAAALYPETPETAARLSALPGAVVIARDHFAEILARDLTRGIVPLAIGAVLSVLLLTWLFFRSVRDTFLALLPVFSSLLFTGALFSLLGKPVTVPVLTAAIILCGLAVDYGIFAVHAIRTGNTDNVFRAVTLSALTTAAGGLTVAFTRHPMLHSAGQTLIAGIGFAWFSALFLLPALVSGKKKKAGAGCCGLLLLLLPVFLTGCRTEPFEYESFPPVSELAGSRTKIPFPDNFSFLGSVVMETPFFSMDFLCAAERKDGFFRIAGLSPGGVKLFETAGKLGEVTEYYFTPAAEIPGDPRDHAETLLRQFEYIFEGLGPCPDPVLKAAKPVMDGTALEKDGRRWAGKNLDLIEKEKAGYYLYRDFGGFRFPVRIVYRGDWGYRLIFRISEAEAMENGKDSDGEP